MGAWDIREYEVLDSTNLEARRLLLAGAGEGLVVTAGHQTAGRGRLDRCWLDQPGKSLLVSIVFGDRGLFLVSALVGLAARGAIRALGGEGPLLKWPNDLVYGRRKVGGILSEDFSVGARRFVIVGLGINLGYLPGELRISGKLAPTSVLVEEGRIWKKEDVLSVFLREVEARSVLMAQDLWAEYEKCLAYVGETVEVEDYALFNRNDFPNRTGKKQSGGVIKGVLLGVDGEGNMVIRTESGLHRVASGDLIPPPD